VKARRTWSLTSSIPPLAHQACRDAYVAATATCTTSLHQYPSSFSQISATPPHDMELWSVRSIDDTHTHTRYSPSEGERDERVCTLQNKKQEMLREGRARKCKAHRSEETKHSPVQDNTRHTQDRPKTILNTRHTQEGHCNQAKCLCYSIFLLPTTNHVRADTFSGVKRTYKNKTPKPFHKCCVLYIKLVSFFFLFFISFC
jgi:hypothetical protein